MRKQIINSLFLLATAYCSQAQNYSDNFDTYSPGTFITSNSTLWSTWGNTPGSNQDSKIDTTNSNSGNNALLFSSSAAGGGPQDAILKFGGVYNLGTFTFQTSMFVENGKGGYINFQNSETAGTVWQMSANFTEDGNVQFFGPGYNLETTYPTNQWFDLKFEGNLNTAHWDVYIDNVLVGSYSSSEENIATLNIFPVNSAGNNQAKYWLDDISYDYVPDTITTNLNGGLLAFESNYSLVVGQNKTPDVIFRNLGLNDITSVKVEFEYNGATFDETFTFPTALTSTEIMTLKPTSSFAIVSGVNELKATILETNGIIDNDVSDNVTTQSIDPIVPAADKLVIAEEATGTWCGWCPRGAVAMERSAKNYHGLFQGIAVHNGDPMTNSIYDTGLGTILDGYPSAAVDRQSDIDPGNIPSAFIEQIQIAPKGKLINGATYDATTRELNVSISVDVLSNLNSNWKIACAIVENDVTGSGSGYNQANYYAPGTNGVMGGYENLPNPVPAADMVYDEVARSISPSFKGYKGFADAKTAGDSKTFNFTFILANDWKVDDIHIVGLFIGSNGKIDNGSTSTINEAIAEGFTSGTEVLGTKEFTFEPNDIQVYPNPSSDVLNIRINEHITESVHYELINSLGKSVLVGKVENDFNTTLDISNYPKGLYFINFNTNNTSGVQKIIIE